MQLKDIIYAKICTLFEENVTKSLQKKIIVIMRFPESALTFSTYDGSIRSEAMTWYK